MATVLELDGVRKRFHGLEAVAGVTAELQDGERLAVIGPNGAGKTTLFNLITGSLRLSGGHIKLFGRDISRWRVYRRVRAGLGRTYQVSSLFMELTVRDNVVIAVQGLSVRKYIPLGKAETAATCERVEELLEQVDLSRLRDTLVSELSHGDHRRLEIALALAINPKILLLDEPMAGLSPGERQSLAQTIKSLPREIAIMIVEHDIDITFDLADRVIVLHEGAVVAADSPSEIRNNATVQSIYLGGM